MNARTRERPVSTTGIRAADRDRWTLRLRTLAAVGTLALLAACSNPLAVQEAPDTLDHASSSGNHTISSGNHTSSSSNHTISSGNLAPRGR